MSAGDDGSQPTSMDDATGADRARTIQQVSQEIGVPAPTLRSWERRYGIAATSRSQGGHRRYTQNEVADLVRMRDQVAAGVRPADAAAQILAASTTAPQELVAAFTEAAENLQPKALRQVLDHARLSLGLDRAVDDVLLPAMRAIGLRWASGHLDVGPEHLASHVTQVWLAQVPVAGAAPRPGQGPVVLCCGPLDHHTLGLESLGALLRHRGWDCRLLGARTTSDALLRAVETTEAAAVVLVCHLPAGRRTAVASLRSVGPRPLPTFYAGGAFTTPQARQGVPGRYLGERLGIAADIVTAALRGPDVR